MMRAIGAISDTHGLLRPQALAALAGCDPIIHAGDIGSPDVLARLGALAQVHAVRGNVDRGAWSREPTCDAAGIVCEFAKTLSLKREDSNLCISESEFARTLSPGREHSNVRIS